MKSGKVFALGLDVYNGEPKINPEYLKLNPKLFKIFLISTDEILLPIIFSNFSELNLICLFLKSLFFVA